MPRRNKRRQRDMGDRSRWMPNGPAPKPAECCQWHSYDCTQVEHICCRYCPRWTQ